MRTSMTRAACTFTVMMALAGTAALPAFASSDPLANLTANQIAAKAAKDLVSASSVHISGYDTEKGVRVAIDMTITQHGCDVSISAGSKDGVHFLTIGKNSWMQPTDKQWQGFGVTTTQLPQYSGKWLALPVTTTSGGITATFTGFTCTSSSSSGGLPHSGWVKGKATTVHGQRELQLINKKQKGSIEVTDSAKPLVLSISQGGTVATFSGYGARVTLTPPPAGDVVTLPASSGQ